MSLVPFQKLSSFPLTMYPQNIRPCDTNSNKGTRMLYNSAKCCHHTGPSCEHHDPVPPFCNSKRLPLLAIGKAMPHNFHKRLSSPQWYCLVLPPRRLGPLWKMLQNVTAKLITISTRNTASELQHCLGSDLLHSLHLSKSTCKLQR